MNSPFKIYNASAGSGKTYTLAKEYLKIILSEKNAYRKILAITFTNKAVNEMKSRILNSLFDFSRFDETTETSPLFNDVSKELHISPSELRRRSATTLKEILHNYAFFDVSTIDKFTHRLIRTFAKDLKLPQNFEVVLDTDLLLEEAVAKLVNKAGSDTKLTRILIDFALEKTDDDKSWDIAIDLSKVGKLLFIETNAPHLKTLAGKEIDDFLRLQTEIKTKRTRIQSQMIASASAALELIDENGLEFSNFSSSYFPKFMQNIQEGGLDIDFKAGWKQNFETLPLYPKSCRAETKALLDALQPNLVHLFNTIKDNYHGYQLLNNVYKNVVPLTVLNAIRQEVKTIEMDRNQLSISEFNTIISTEIKDQPAPFIYERLGEKYRHYFIDEFQDTSEMQWNNLIPLVENALSGENGSLFLVGDAKQAIYRWRGGKAEQFLNLVNTNTNPFVVAPQIENLPTNFRSHEEIINFNNAFFTATSTMLSNEPYRTLFKEGNNQGSNTKKGGHVDLTFLASDEDEDEDLEEKYCNAVLQTIANITQRNYNFADICIIVRSNKEGVRLADFLSQHDVPIISSESLLLKGNAKARFLIDLIHLLERPNDMNLAYEILYFLSDEDENSHQFIAKHLANVPLLLQNEYGFDLLNGLKNLSVYDVMEYAIKQFDLSPTSDAYINYFMDVVMEVEQKDGIGTSSLLDYWEKKKDRLSITVPSTINAIQIMTIHKAKGLEFDIVIFPFANTNIYQEIDPKIWLPVEPASFSGFEEVLISKKQEVIDYSPQAATLYNEEQYRLELDAFNVLYVALTRAVKALFIITKKDLSQNGEHKTNYYSGLFVHFLKDQGLWLDEKNKYTFGEFIDNDGRDQLQEQEKILYQYSYKESPRFKILTKSGSLWDTDRQDALSKGNLIHFIMGLVETENDLDKAMEIVIRSGDLAVDELSMLRAKLLQIIQHPSLSIYYKEGHTIMNERDIITETGRIFRPDRIVIIENQATVIDYKTGKKDPKYNEQLFAYADALEAMGYRVAHKIIVYINENIITEFI